MWPGPWCGERGVRRISSSVTSTNAFGGCDHTVCERPDHHGGLSASLRGVEQARVEGAGAQRARKIAVTNERGQPLGLRLGACSQKHRETAFAPCDESIGERIERTRAFRAMSARLRDRALEIRLIASRERGRLAWCHLETGEISERRAAGDCRSVERESAVPSHRRCDFALVLVQLFEGEVRRARFSASSVWARSISSRDRSRDGRRVVEARERPRAGNRTAFRAGSRQARSPLRRRTRAHSPRLRPRLARGSTGCWPASLRVLHDLASSVDRGGAKIASGWAGAIARGAWGKLRARSVSLARSRFSGTRGFSGIRARLLWHARLLRFFLFWPPALLRCWKGRTGEAIKPDRRRARRVPEARSTVATNRAPILAPRTSRGLRRGGPASSRQRRGARRACRDRALLLQRCVRCGDSISRCGTTLRTSPVAGTTKKRHLSCFFER